MNKLNKQFFDVLNGIGGNLDNISALIEAGANVNAVDENGLTPLQIAARDGRTDLAKLLVKKGADVDLIDKAGNTPLRLAIISGHTKCAKFLIKHTVSENYQTEKPDFLSDESYRFDRNRDYLEEMSKYLEKEIFLLNNKSIFDSMSKDSNYVINRDESLDSLVSDAENFLKKTQKKIKEKFSATMNFNGIIEYRVNKRYPSSLKALALGEALLGGILNDLNVEQAKVGPVIE